MKLFNNLPGGLKDPVTVLKKAHSKPEAIWSSRGEAMALRLFHEMSVRVPAYRDFLASNEVDPSSIKTIADFKTLPTLDKDNYLRKYSRKELSWDGIFGEGGWSISTTSGSTGEPFYFPRQQTQDEQYALVAEMYLRQNFQIHKRKTLYIIAFPMGAWIGGVFTYEALQLVRKRGDYDLSIITPGINKDEIINAFRELAPDYDQVIIGSYAPFLKDILDDGERKGIKWGDHELGFVFSAEGFTEKFRDYVVKKTGIKDPLRQTLNHYGTVDLGTMAHETPISILIRRVALEHPALYQELFTLVNRQPTLAQYIPELFYFEEGAGAILCTAQSGIPLVRYDLKDRGGVMSGDRIRDIFLKHNVDLDSELSKTGLSGEIWNLPFVYVYERSDFSVSFYAFQVYPETIRKALQDDRLEDQLTGKFTMLVDFDKTGQQHLEINVELKQGGKGHSKLEKQVQERVTQQLVAENSEFRETFQLYGSKILPRIVFWEYEDPTYFKIGTKQKWVKQ